MGEDFGPLEGREALRVQLLEKLEHRQTQIVIHGTAGMGKSHFTQAVVREWLDSKADRFVFFLNAETRAGLRRDYEKIITTFGGQAPSRRISISSLAAMVWTALTSTSEFEWIVVFDDAPDEPDVFQSRFFPTPLEDWSNGRIILTTRSHEYCDADYLDKPDSLKVGELDEDAALRLLKRNLTDFEDDFDSEAKSLIKNLCRSQLWLSTVLS